MKTPEKKLFLKITGVTPAELKELHVAVDALEETKLPEQCNIDGRSPTHMSFVEFKSVVLDKASGSYTVQLEMDVAIKCRLARNHERTQDQLLLAPRTVIDTILSVFTQLFPKETTILPMRQ